MDYHIINRGFDFEACFTRCVYYEKIVLRRQDKVIQYGFTGGNLFLRHILFGIIDTPYADGTQTTLCRVGFYFQHFLYVLHIADSSLIRFHLLYQVFEVCVFPDFINRIMD